MKATLNWIDQVLTLPAPVVAAAYVSLIGKPVGTKAEMARELAAGLSQGAFLFDQVLNAVPQKAAPITAKVTNSAAIGQALAITEVQSKMAEFAQRTDSDIQKLGAEFGRINTGLETVVRGVKQNMEDNQRVQQELAGLRVAVGQARSVATDRSEINTAIAAAVTAEFGAFKQTIIDAGLQAAAAEAAAIHPIGTGTALDVFGVDVRDIHGNPVMVTLFNAPDAPAIDANFVWTEGILKHLLLAQQHGEHLWFGGERGTGKTETARQFAARTGRGFVRINFHKYSTSDEYLGCTGLVNGATEFVDGDFLRAYATVGCIVLLDEITNAPAGELAPLNALLEPNAAVNIGGKVRRRANGMLVFAADNTLGNGDTSGRYTGTTQMNTALLDRFARVVQFKHLSKMDEIAAVARHTGCAPELAEAVLDAVQVARTHVEKGEIVDAPSIRQVMAMIRALPVLGVDDAWETCIATRQPEESRIGLNAIKAAVLNTGKLRSLI